ncbi:MAG: Uma2 family endonuclease [Candidatus Omnitrophota bacterium]|nr:MAG: Uma2 family endonuclease [Candidatus Omnitrophota bacterium]
MIPSWCEIDYPETDGKPMGETDIHVQELLDVLATLKDYFRNDADIYVAGNIMFYYEEGNPHAVISPDLFVVKGIQKQFRRIYKLWEERIPPCFVLEITSRSTRLEDVGTKRALYAMLGVSEYFLFDPSQEYLIPPLQGYRLAQNEFLRLEMDDEDSIASRELQLRLCIDHNRLRLIDRKTGEKLLRTEEIAEALRREISARQIAEAELMNLKTELKRLRGQ